MDLTDETVISSFLDSGNYDEVFCAIRRVGELKLTNVKGKVGSWVATSEPDANVGKGVMEADIWHIFNMGVLVLGKIGDKSDGIILSGYLWGNKDNISQVCLLQALGSLTDSDTALDTLNKYAVTLDSKTRSDVVKQLATRSCSIIPELQ